MIIFFISFINFSNLLKIFFWQPNPCRLNLKILAFITWWIIQIKFFVYWLTTESPLHIAFSVLMKCDLSRNLSLRLMSELKTRVAAWIWHKLALGNFLQVDAVCGDPVSAGGGEMGGGLIERLVSKFTWVVSSVSFLDFWQIFIFWFGWNFTAFRIHLTCKIYIRNHQWPNNQWLLSQLLTSSLQSRKILLRRA